MLSVLLGSEGDAEEDGAKEEMRPGEEGSDSREEEIIGRSSLAKHWST